MKSDTPCCLSELSGTGEAPSTHAIRASFIAFLLAHFEGTDPYRAAMGALLSLIYPGAKSYGDHLEIHGKDWEILDSLPEDIALSIRCDVENFRARATPEARVARD